MSSSSSADSFLPPLSADLRIKLSVMMFLQFAVWGAWFVILGNYLGHLGFGKTFIGWMYALMPLGAIVSTMFAGQLADRYFSSERLMAVMHLVGAGLMWGMAQIQSVDQAPTLFILTLLYSLVYNPTLALSNSIAFTHIPSGERDFPSIRVMGTIGWIAANLIVGMVLSTAETPAYHTNLPLLLAAGFSVALGLFSFMLPHTPPTGKPGDAVPFLKAFGLLKEFSFAVFFGVSFIITIVLAFYYGFTGLYLEKGQAVKDVASTMTIGQWAEMILLPFLPWFLRNMGMKWVLALGMFCWGLRYGLFAISGSNPDFFSLVLIGVALHGVCFDFFFAAGFIHVDNTAPKDIRASGQALFSVLTYGLGMYLGNVLSGYVADYYTDATTGATDWAGFWTVPAVGVLLSLAIFVAFFRQQVGKEEDSLAAGESVPLE